MAENLDDICVQYQASRNPEINQTNNGKYAQWGCYECNGFNKECEHYVPLKEVKYPVED